jgi:hypothetical protein
MERATKWSNGTEHGKTMQALPVTETTRAAASYKAGRRLPAEAARIRRQRQKPSPSAFQFPRCKLATNGRSPEAWELSASRVKANPNQTRPNSVD